MLYPLSYGRTVIIEEGGQGVSYRIVCAQETNAFFITQLVYEGGLLLIGCALAYKTRNMKEDFGESKQLSAAIYNIALVGIIILIVANVVEAYEGTIRLFICVGVCWTTSPQGHPKIDLKHLHLLHSDPCQNTAPALPQTRFFATSHC